MVKKSKKNRLKCKLNFKARNWRMEARSWRLGSCPGAPGGWEPRNESGVGVPKNREQKPETGDGAQWPVDVRLVYRPQVPALESGLN